MKINEKFRSLIPPLAPEEYAQLEANIIADGCRDPLVTWNETLIDGHNRYAICQKHGIKFDTLKKGFKDEDEACLWIIDNAFGRRNLPIVTRVELQEKRKQFIKSRQGERSDLNPEKKCGCGVQMWEVISNTERKCRGCGLVLTSVKNFTEVKTPIERLSEKAGVSKPTYIAAKLCLEHADDETKVRLRRNEISVHRVAKDIKEKLQRDNRAKTRLQTAAKNPMDENIIVGDFRSANGKIADGTVSLIFTDPPYDREASKMLPDLAEFASKKLADGGSLICYVGQTQIPAALDAFRLHLRYWWTIACVHSGRATVMREYGINAGWKAVLWFVKGTRDDNSVMVSDVMSGGEEKTHHDWQQSQSEAEYWIEKLCPKDGIVCDPFLGGGTTAAAAKKLGRNWVGIEKNPATARIASGRVSQ